MSTNISKLLKNNKENIVAQTLKVPKNIDFFAKDLAESMEISKHEVMIAFLLDGMAVAKKEIDDDARLEVSFEEAVSTKKKFFLLNTNIANDLDAHLMMSKDGVAAAFDDPWKKKIEKIKKGDVVFLYKSGAGIIGHGYADGNLKKSPYGKDAEGCYSQKLVSYKKLEIPMPASKILKELGRKIPFACTMISIPDGEKIQLVLEQ